MQFSPMLQQHLYLAQEGNLAIAVQSIVAETQLQLTRDLNVRFREIVQEIEDHATDTKWISIYMVVSIPAQTPGR